MIVVAWILLIAFGLFSLSGWLKFYFGKTGLNPLHFFSVIVTTIITALCAGYLFGGLHL